MESPWKRIASTACSPLALTPSDDLVRILGDGAARRSRGLGKAIGDRVAMEADRLDSLFAACADPSDDLVRVLGDGAAGRRGGLGKPVDDRVAVEADRLDSLFAACADPGDDLVRVIGDGAARRLGGAATSWSATNSPWARIASTVCSPLALTRPTTSSA